MQNFPIQQQQFIYTSGNIKFSVFDDDNVSVTRSAPLRPWNA